MSLAELILVDEVAHLRGKKLRDALAAREKATQILQELDATGHRAQWAIRETGGVAVSRGVLNRDNDPDPELPPGMVRSERGAVPAEYLPIATANGAKWKFVTPGPFPGVERCSYGLTTFQLEGEYRLQVITGSDPEVLRNLREGYRWSPDRNTYAKLVDAPVPAWLGVEPTISLPPQGL